jgi:hypothetical protein
VQELLMLLQAQLPHLLLTLLCPHCQQLQCLLQLLLLLPLLLLLLLRQLQPPQVLVLLCLHQQGPQHLLPLLLQALPLLLQALPLLLQALLLLQQLWQQLSPSCPLQPCPSHQPCPLLLCHPPWHLLLHPCSSVRLLLVVLLLLLLHLVYCLHPQLLLVPPGYQAGVLQISCVSHGLLLLLEQPLLVLGQLRGVLCGLR